MSSLFYEGVLFLSLCSFSSSSVHVAVLSVKSVFVWVALQKQQCSVEVITFYNLCRIFESLQLECMSAYFWHAKRNTFTVTMSSC